MTQFSYEYKDKSFSNKFELCEHIGWNNLNWDNLCLSKIKTANDFGGYKFKRIKNSNLHDPAIKRIKKLRDKYDYLRFWYSGGKDSNSVLIWAEEADVLFDEIVIFESTCYDNKEARSIKVPEHYKNKVTVFKLTPYHYNLVYKNLDWWKYGTVHDIQGMCENNMLYRYVIPETKEITMPHNFIDIMGGRTPTIWFDKIWKFFLNEYECTGHTYNYCENFLINETVPELYEAYVNCICDQLEEQGLYLGQQSMTRYVEKQRKRTRFMRDLIPFFKNMKTEFQYDKLVEPMDFDFFQNEPWADYNQTYKDFLNLKNCYKNNPEYFRNYCSADWDTINKMKDWGTIVTKEYVLTE